MSAARDFTARRFGALTSTQRTIHVVGTSPVQIRPNNPNCLLYNVVNSGASRITVDYSGQVVDNDGYILGGNGAVLTGRVDLDGDAVGYELFAVSNAAGGRVTVLEVVQEVTSSAEE